MVPHDPTKCFEMYYRQKLGTRATGEGQDAL